MSAYNIKHLYRYIIKRGNSYTIRRQRKYYGTYGKLENAMLERDLLEDVNWDVAALINLPSVVNNRYFEWDLPPFPTLPRNDVYGLPKYITRGSKGNYRVQKLLDGKVCSFGTYSRLEDAVNVRDELIRVGWNKDKIKGKNGVLI